MKIGFIGLGNMASAMIGGMIAKNIVKKEFDNIEDTTIDQILINLLQFHDADLQYLVLANV